MYLNRIQDVSKMAAETENGCRQCIMLSISVSPCYSTTKFYTHVKMYSDEYIEIICTSLKVNENQDGCQIPKCLPKTDRYNVSQVLISFSDTSMGSYRIYVGNICSSKSAGTQVSLLLGIQDCGQDSKWLSPMCREQRTKNKENKETKNKEQREQSR